MMVLETIRGDEDEDEYKKEGKGRNNFIDCIETLSQDL